MLHACENTPPAYHTTQRYAHIADTVLRDAVNKASQTIARAAKGKAPAITPRSK